MVALESGWIVTEVGRQPWIVYGLMRTEEAVTERRRALVRRSPAPSLLYSVLGRVTVLALRAIADAGPPPEDVAGRALRPPDSERAAGPA